LFGGSFGSSGVCLCAAIRRWVNAEIVEETAPGNLLSRSRAPPFTRR
jgi:hypothetical protein